jgi:histidine triad (HIT) family protein
MGVPGPPSGVTHDHPTDDDCVFCAILAGEIPGDIVHDGDHAAAFLDANPLAPGHTLVVPRGHHARLGDLPAADADALYDTLHRVRGAVAAATDADALSIGVNDGPAAGQEVPHVHAHVVPRFEGDGGAPFHAVGGTRPDQSDDERAELAETIGTRLE